MFTATLRSCSTGGVATFDAILTLHCRTEVGPFQCGVALFSGWGCHVVMVVLQCLMLRQFRPRLKSTWLHNVGHAGCPAQDEILKTAVFSVVFPALIGFVLASCATLDPR